MQHFTKRSKTSPLFVPDKGLVWWTLLDYDTNTDYHSQSVFFSVWHVTCCIHQIFTKNVDIHYKNGTMINLHTQLCIINTCSVMISDCPESD